MSLHLPAWLLNNKILKDWPPIQIKRKMTASPKKSCLEFIVSCGHTENKYFKEILMSELFFKTVSAIYQSAHIGV